MQSSRYALVTYVRDPVGEFVETLRRELHPEMPHLAAHLSILPPRRLSGTEQQAVEALTEICRTVEPFEIELDGVETFVPVTPTIYLRVGQAAHRLRELHDLLSQDAALRGKEDWPYMPHMTIIKTVADAHARAAMRVARDRWGSFSGTRRVRIEELTFVREEENYCWVDLSSVTLGSRQQVGSRK
jgi:2'-5' RNA ligase